MDHIRTHSWSSLSLLLWGLIVTVLTYCGDSVNIKIVDPPHTNRYYSSSSPKALTLRAPPANISGPTHLRLLAGECFKLRHKSYTYTVCPFHNVTQKEDSSVWNNYHGVLGVWREWIIDDDRFVGMHYTLGEPCGSNDREIKVLFNCSTVTLLTNVTEPSTCKYTIWLYTPLACFKGAMQIYHVMKQDLIDAWDAVNFEYSSGDLTKKGVSKRRRNILLEAGLYYNFTKDKEFFKQQAMNRDAQTTSSNTFTVKEKTELEQCNKRAEGLVEQLQNVKTQIEAILRIVADKDLQLRGKIELYLAKTSHNETNTTVAVDGPSSHSILSTELIEVQQPEEQVLDPDWTDLGLETADDG